jgi:cytochrome c-type biogenesis protein CcmH/NrfG
MTTPSTPDTLWLPLAELQRAGLVAALPPDATAVTVQPLGAGIAAVKAPSGAQVCVILSPAAWQRIQALDARWRRLFGWAAEHLDTPTLRQLTTVAERALAQHPGRGGAWRQS